MLYKKIEKKGLLHDQITDCATAPSFCNKTFL